MHTPTTADLALAHALRLGRACDGKRLDQLLLLATSRGVSLERLLRDCGELDPIEFQRALDARSRAGRSCSNCAELTFLSPGQTTTGTPCERCGGALMRDRSTTRTRRAGSSPRLVAPAAPPRKATELTPASGCRAAPRSRPHVRRLALYAATLLSGALLLPWSGASLRPGAPVPSAAETRPRTLLVRVHLPTGVDPRGAGLQLRLGDASPTPLTELVDRIERPSRPVELTVHREGAPYLRALVGPEDDHVDLSVRSTAVGLVLDGLNQPSDDALLVGRAAAEREPAVHELATFLAGCLAVGARSIDDARRFPGFAHKRLHAVQSVQRAARAREQSRP